MRRLLLASTVAPMVGPLGLPLEWGARQVFVNTLAIDPKKPMALYVGLYISPSGNSVYKSTDGGISWYPSSTGLPNPLDIFDLAVDPENSANIYASFVSSSTVNGGIFKSIDNGGSWQDTTSGIEPLIPATIQPNRTISTMPAAIPNCPFPFFISANNIAIDSKTPAILFAVVNGFVFRTSDGAGTWIIAQSGLPFFAFQIGVSHADHTTAYAANQGIWVYTGTGGSGGGDGAAWRLSPY